MRPLFPGCLALFAAFGCTPRGAPERPPAALAVRHLDAPAQPGSGQPNLAVAADGSVLLSWIEPAGDGAHALRYSVLGSGGAWSPPRTIAQGSGWFVNWADFPAMSALPDGTLFAHWLAKSGPGTYAYDVRLARSVDGGGTWSAPVVPHRDGTQTEHGFVSLAPWDGASVGVVWLDGRQTAGVGHGEHAAPAAAMSLMHSTLDRGGRLGPETVLDERVCDCCQTDAARADGAVVVVYRDRSDTEVRDLSVVRFAGGQWSKPRPLADDGWQINGCPVNGPAIDASGRAVAVAWFTAPQDKARVRVAFSADAGERFGAPIVVDDERPLGRVDVVLREPHTALVSWLAQGTEGTTLRVREVRDDGWRGDPLTVAVSSAARSSGFPRMASSRGQVILAWRDAAEPPRVRTARLEAGLSAGPPGPAR
jgi:hypothetical protein